MGITLFNNITMTCHINIPTGQREFCWQTFICGMAYRKLAHSLDEKSKTE